MDRTNIKTILLSRDDNLGDAILLLPAAGILKKHYPDSRILFLGRSYQRKIIESCRHFDGFLDWGAVKDRTPAEQAEFLAIQQIDVFVSIKPRRPIATAAKLAKIPHRIGSADRIFHYFTCNHITLQWRQKSRWHEAQTNIRTLSPLLEKIDYGIDELEPFLGFDQIEHSAELAKKYLSSDRFNLILHPLSNGHAREWPLQRYLELIQLLPVERYNILVSGSEKEAEVLREKLLPHCPGRVHDLTGKLNITELIDLISQADGLVAASTGPLHIAAATGIHTLGLYVQRWQLRPGRYGPIGKRVSIMVHDEHCPTCLANKDCDCIQSITAERVAETISEWPKMDQPAR